MSQAAAPKAGPEGGVSLQDITDEARRLPDFDDHEQVLLGLDPRRGFQAIIAIHDTRLGPALGGTRLWSYPSRAAAITDALRLSQGMTLKAAICDVPFGGGKAVIMLDPVAGKTLRILDAYAEMLNAVADRFLTGEDVGLSLADADYLRDRAPNVSGTSRGGSGNPAPITATGVFLGLKAAVRHRLGAETLSGLHVAVQGLGAVGGRLCAMLHEDGARLSVADVDPARVEDAAVRHDATPVDPEAIATCAADVFAPCALGAALNARTIPDMRAAVVAGSANNQLETHSDAELLRRRGILYAPDFVINAGGLINVAAERAPGGYDRADVMRRVARIPEALAEIFRRADAAGSPTDAVAEALAREKLRLAGRPDKGGTGRAKGPGAG